MLKFIKSIHPVFQVLIAVLFMAFFSQIEIVLPIHKDGIPITGQTFAVLLVGFFLGLKLGVTTVLIYLVLGALGLPFFAGGASGIEALKDDSAGFLFGFVFGVATTGYFGEKGWGVSFMKCLTGMALGTLIITVSGLVLLTARYGFIQALEYGFYPFIWGAIIKVVLGATIPPLYHNLIKER